MGIGACVKPTGVPFGSMCRKDVFGHVRHSTTLVGVSQAVPGLHRQVRQIRRMSAG